MSIAFMLVVFVSAMLMLVAFVSAKLHQPNCISQVASAKLHQLCSCWWRLYQLVVLMLAVFMSVSVLSSCAVFVHAPPIMLSCYLHHQPPSNLSRSRWPLDERASYSWRSHKSAVLIIRFLNPLQPTFVMSLPVVAVFMSFASTKAVVAFM